MLQNSLNMKSMSCYFFPVIFLNIEYRNLGILMNLILCNFITYQALGAVGALGIETFL